MQTKRGEKIYTLKEVFKDQHARQIKKWIYLLFKLDMSSPTYNLI